MIAATSLSITERTASRLLYATLTVSFVTSAGTPAESGTLNVAPPDPNDPRILYKPADFDFTLRPGSTAVDAGVHLPNVNDGFTGRAPDLGAYEIGQPVPHYGPRP